VHHTTEGSSAQGAIAAYREHNSAPHFTVDATTIHQHIDTARAARALRNPPGGVETNRDSAIQIEVVGFAGRPKDQQTLANVARLCRWIEQTHGVPQLWPNGLPRPAVNGHDPGGHNRNASIWNSQGGHYGHCHVPENTHWDPAYTQGEVNLVMATGNMENVVNADMHVADTHVAAPGPVLILGQRVPDQSEATTVGPFLAPIPRNSSTLVRNDNPEIVFANDEGNDDDRFMTRRLQEKADTLANLVMQEWPGVKLRVTDAWDEGQGHAPTSRHYEGRAADMTTFPRDSSKLGRLCSLAVQAGFDWVFFENAQHIHASVIRDEVVHEALSNEGFDEQAVQAEGGLEDLVTELRNRVAALQQEDHQLEVKGAALTPEEKKRIEKINDNISRLEAAIILLSPTSRR
jgi:hypothetical protein